ncbi:MAG: terminase small subunit [Gammaproteobacteria bacterium]|nr:terminase small subunit [Gammaproteobacteria bacterium]
MKELTPKQELFVKEYPVDLNATQAAIRAGYSAATARKIAHKLMLLPHIRDRVHASMDKRNENVKLTAETVITDLLRLQRKAEEDGTWAAAIKATELLGRHLQMFVDRVEMKHSGGIKVNVLFGRDE